MKKIYIAGKVTGLPIIEVEQKLASDLEIRTIIGTKKLKKRL